MYVLLSTIATTTVSNYFDQSSLLWALVVGCFLAFLLGVGIGANDLPNAFATCVGSGSLTRIQAYILSTIFESMGSLLVGWSIVDSLRTGVVDVAVYDMDPEQYFLGQVATLGGCALWLFLATALNMPVSPQHSIIGAAFGFTFVTKGTRGVRMRKLSKIVVSWFVSPVLSGIISVCIYIVMDFAVLRRRNSFECGLISLPVIYFICVSFTTFIVVYQGASRLYFDILPLWSVIAISIELGLIVSILTYFFVILRIRRKHKNPSSDLFIDFIEATDHKKHKYAPQKQLNEINGPMSFMSWILPDRNRVDDPATLHLASSIQVFTACFFSFAHGATDVGDIIMPLLALVDTYITKTTTQPEYVPIPVQLFGLFSVIIGLWLFGYRIMETVGSKVTKINPASGFTIEIGAAITAMLAGRMDLPIDQTHCIFGSVVAVGCLKTGEGIKWKLLLEVLAAWFITVPASGLFSAGIMAFLKQICL